MSRGRSLILTAVLLAAASPAAAHRGSSSLSVVEVEADTGRVTVTHRLAAHDVEPALVDIAPEAQPSLDDSQAVAALVAYAGRSFVLWDETGARITLTHAETDLAGDDVRLTYTGRLPAPAKAMSVDSGLLEESRRDQENQVNIRRARITKTLLFRPGQDAQTVTFD